MVDRKNTFVLVTGASSGIGKALAIEAAKDNRNLILISQDKQKLDAVKKEIAINYHVKIVMIVQDLSEQDAAQTIYKTLQKQNLTIDTLINNAGIGMYGEFSDNDKKQLHSMLMVNIITLTELTRAFLPDLIKQHDAKILNVASVAGFLPGPFMSAYFASKHYVLTFSESLREELRDTGVTVTCLCPPATNTQFARTANVAQKNYIATTRLTPTVVAAFGYSAMKKGRVIAVYSTSSRIFISFISRLMPRFTLRKLMFTLNSHGK